MRLPVELQTQTRDGFTPQDVMEQHRNGGAGSYDRILLLDRQIKAAIQQGDTGRVRQLDAQKKSVEAAHECESGLRNAAARTRRPGELTS